MRKFCLSLPHVKEDIKWGHDLCFLIGEKMFCVAGIEGPFMVTLKVPDESFAELIEKKGIEPAPYLARYKWVRVDPSSGWKKKDWEFYIRQSYELIKSKLQPKVLKNLR
ncbi:MAG TPA: MmcQ/YjbR family DNA-binding protein [Bacteroidia bacterium]|nr:MmcQ/YjbR family DNA-binding protein [Bacteroidia bacterium]